MDSSTNPIPNDSTVISIGGGETPLFNKQKIQGWRCLQRVAHVIQVFDTKRFVHAVKFGLALVLVSLLYMLEAVHDKLGDNAMWAVMTVVVVFEHTAGATISKGFNRGVGTILGGGIGSLIAILAQEFGGVTKAVVIGISIFIFGGTATYMRTMPSIKKKYDYGVMIFILTLSLVAISGVRVDEIIQVASDRLSSISMGFAICGFITIFILPMWAGDELHSSLASKFNFIANSIQDGLEYHTGSINGKKAPDEARKPSDYFSVLSSKTKDESLAYFAKWEPWHGKFGFYHPWNKYLQITRLLGELAARMVAAEGHFEAKLEISSLSLLWCTREQCEAACLLIVKTMKELGDCTLYMKKFQRQEVVLEELQEMRVELSSHVQVSSQAMIINQTAGSENGMKNSGVHMMILLVLLVDIIEKVEEIVKEVKELGICAGFSEQILDDKS